MPKKRREFRRFNDFKGLNDAPRPVFRARSDFEAPGARKPPKSTKNHKNNLKRSATNHKNMSKNHTKNYKKGAKNCKKYYYNKNPSVRCAGHFLVKTCVFLTCAGHVVRSAVKQQV